MPAAQRVEGYVRRRVHGADGDDVMGELVLALCEHDRRHGAPADPASYAVGVARNVIAAHWGRQHRAAGFEPFEHEGAAVDHGLAAVEALDAARRLTPRRDRRVLGLVLGGATAREVAEALGCSLSVAEKRVTTVRRRLVA